MATLKGRGGKLQVTAPDASTAWQNIASTGLTMTDIGQITEWRINTTMGTEEVTEFGDTWTERVTTIKDWSGDARGFVDPSNAVNQDEILGILITGGMTKTITQGTGEAEEVLKVAFFTDKTNDRGFVGNMIPSFEIDGAVGGVFAVSFTFVGTGALEYSTNITV